MIQARLPLAPAWWWVHSYRHALYLKSQTGSGKAPTLYLRSRPFLLEWIKARRVGPDLQAHQLCAMIYEPSRLTATAALIKLSVRYRTDAASAVYYASPMLPPALNSPRASSEVSVRGGQIFVLKPFG